MPLCLRLALSLALIAAPLGAQNTASDTGPAVKIAGQFAARARNDSASVPGTVGSADPARAERPRAVPALTVPKSSATKRVSAPQNLQAALNKAVAGDSLILSGTFRGNFTLPARSCTGWVTIVGAGLATPEGERLTPRAAAALPKLITPNHEPALRTKNPTCGWRLVGIEVTGTLPVTSMQYGLVWLGDGGDKPAGQTQTTLAAVPRDIILDRVYIHGSPTLNSTRCLALNSANTIVINSWFSECHALGSDSQAIEGWNGPGPYLIENNFLGGAGENIMFGGADPGIANLSPSDITIRRNHVAKDPAWRGKWTVKNLTELKNARRVLYEGNVFETTWPAGQESAIVFKSSQDSCGSCVWEGTSDVTFEWNIVRNAPIALNLQAYDESGQVRTNVWVQRVTVENNLFAQIGAEGRGALNLWTHPLRDVTLSHNTFVHAPGSGGLVFAFAYAGGAARNIAISDNVFTAPGGYAVNYDGGQLHSAGFTAMAGDRSWSFERNVIGGVEGQFSKLYPATNWYPRTVAAIGLGADYSLGPTSPYKSKGRGGKDPGVDIAELTRRTAGVVVTP